jgi:hypothetical protein
MLASQKYDAWQVRGKSQAGGKMKLAVWENMLKELKLKLCSAK